MIKAVILDFYGTIVEESYALLDRIAEVSLRTGLCSGVKRLLRCGGRISVNNAMRRTAIVSVCKGIFIRKYSNAWQEKRGRKA